MRRTTVTYAMNRKQGMTAAEILMAVKDLPEYQPVTVVVNRRGGIKEMKTVENVEDIP